MLLPEWQNQRVQITTDYLIQFVECQIDPMISDSPLGKIVGSDAL
jgi:hypothetical protein